MENFDFELRRASSLEPWIEELKINFWKSTELYDKARSNAVELTAKKWTSVKAVLELQSYGKSIFNYLRIIFFDKKFCEKVPLINVECSWWLVLAIFCGSIRSLIFNSLKFGFIWVLVSLGWEARDRKRTSESPTRGEMERRRYPHHLKLWQNW